MNRDKEGESLKSLRERITRWRRHHGGPGRRLPEWVWLEAAAIARVTGVAETARALRLPADRLESIVQGQEARAAKDAAAFVEVEVVDAAASGGSGVTVELEGPQGARVRVLGGSAEAVARVAASLLKVSGS